MLFHVNASLRQNAFCPGGNFVTWLFVGNFVCSYQRWKISLTSTESFSYYTKNSWFWLWNVMFFIWLLRNLPVYSVFPQNVIARWQFFAPVLSTLLPLRHGVQFHTLHFFSEMILLIIRHWFAGLQRNRKNIFQKKRKQTKIAGIADNKKKIFSWDSFLLSVSKVLIIVSCWLELSGC